MGPPVVGTTAPLPAVFTMVGARSAHATALLPLAARLLAEAGLVDRFREGARLGIGEGGETDPMIVPFDNRHAPARRDVGEHVPCARPPDRGDGSRCTEGDVAQFSRVTGDYNPYHIDQTFVETSWFGRRIIPGLLTSSMITHIGGMIGFLATEMHFQYTAAVYIGDTITCTVTIQEKNEEKRLVFATATFVNQHGAEVLQSQFSGFPSHIRLAR